MRRVRMHISAAGTELSTLQQHSSRYLGYGVATELRNLGLDNSKPTAVLATTDPNCASLGPQQQ